MFASYINYSRYLLVYLLEMFNLPLNHSEIHKQYLEGALTFKRKHKNFANEQTACRISKNKGGMREFSKGVVNRWILSYHVRGSVTRKYEAKSGKEHSGTRSVLLQRSMKRDKTDVEKIVDTVNCMVNPFEYEQWHGKLLQLNMFKLIVNLQMRKMHQISQSFVDFLARTKKKNDLQPFLRYLNKMYTEKTSPWKLTVTS